MSRSNLAELHGFEWKKARKREIAVSVAFSRPPEVIETLEGQARCGACDAILTGFRGEQWPVQRELFEKLYLPEPLC